MTSLSASLRFLFNAVIAGLALAFLLSLLRPDWVQTLRGRFGDERLGAAYGPVSYAAAVAKAAPTVVSIYTERVMTAQPLRIIQNPTLQRFSGIPLGQPRRQLVRALGSGVIVSSDGLVLTNHHVIDNADDIQVALWNQQVTRARIVGSDPDTDLAVLKIDGNQLPAMPLDFEPEVAVGDVVLAIGNPFGLSQTVTQGIVSGLGRTGVNNDLFERFIQTDAAINEGNSGGALINARGELIGINTVVLAGRSGAEGIGFAIPLSTAREVLNQIIDHGMVVRGWLGADYGDAPILPGGLPTGSARGVALTRITAGSPADLGGLRPGDVLTEFNGQPIEDQDDLRQREAALAPGTVVTVAGFRAGLPIHGELTLTQRPSTRGR